MKFIVVFGQLTLDFSEARLAPGITTLELRVSCSSARLILPPGLPVCDELSVLVSSHERDPGIPEHPERGDEPSLLLLGKTVFASLELRLRRPAGHLALGSMSPGAHGKLQV